MSKLSRPSGIFFSTNVSYTTA